MSPRSNASTLIHYGALAEQTDRPLAVRRSRLRSSRGRPPIHRACQRQLGEGRQWRDESKTPAALLPGMNTDGDAAAALVSLQGRDDAGGAVAMPAELCLRLLALST